MNSVAMDDAVANWDKEGYVVHFSVLDMVEVVKVREV